MTILCRIVAMQIFSTTAGPNVVGDVPPTNQSRSRTHR